MLPLAFFNAAFVTEPLPAGARDLESAVALFRELVRPICERMGFRAVGESEELEGSSGSRVGSRPADRRASRRALRAGRAHAGPMQETTP